ncbi:MAG TPA: phosphate acyltransferase PlsX, partial [Chloroflexota bacterium]|nr:phosphate acyltransferase PlsX [Chloroflexota bacterium]
MKIAIDAMGGDFGPGEIVRAAIQADRDEGVRIILVGDEATLRQEIDQAGGGRGNVEIAPASQVVEMGEQPTVAVRTKRDSSIVVGIRLVKDSDAHAFVSPGNSGAVMAAALFGLGRIAGVERPALAVRFPTVAGSALVLDVGANVECTAQYLKQFGQMGAAYEERVFGIERPRVALLSNGEESSKGTACIIEAHALLRASDLNFIGNVEGKDIPFGQANVIVTDGFTGNVVLKLAEGMGSFLKGMIRDEARRDPIST